MFPDLSPLDDHRYFDRNSGLNEQGRAKLKEIFPDLHDSSFRSVANVTMLRDAYTVGSLVNHVARKLASPDPVYRG